MSKLIMMVGIVASGKSFAAKQLALKENAVIHSSDALRIELFGDVNEVDKNGEVFQELHKRIKNDLINGRNVIYDATNLSNKRRKTFLDELKKINCIKECYLIATPYEKCLEQNRQRERKVPEQVIKRMYKSIFIPQFYEGWDDIYIVWNYEKEEYDINKLLSDLKEIPQDNPNHTLTIGWHCKKCKDNVLDKTDDVVLGISALLHDVGKKFTKQFNNAKGEDTDIAHYYNHQNVSAYLSLFYLDSKDVGDKAILEISNYIQWHMMPFFLNTEKSRNKFINLVGQEFYDKLLVLHDADVKAK